MEAKHSGSAPEQAYAPWPRGPVVTSTPGVMKHSGWPGVLQHADQQRRQCYGVGTCFIDHELFAAKTAPVILAAQLAEGLEVIHREIVASQVQVGVLQRARVAVRQDEAVPVELEGTVGPIKVQARSVSCRSAASTPFA